MGVRQYLILMLTAFLLIFGFATVALDAWLVRNGMGDWFWLPSPSSAQAFFATIATAAMTALTLTYSLTLVVFTLAAANIGPRLLGRFTSEITIQITAGLFGGTFLYALNALFFLDQD